jgi:hypothetical protein
MSLLIVTIGGAKMSQKSLRYLKILGAGTVKLGNFCSGDPQIIEVTVKIFVCK